MNEFAAAMMAVIALVTIAENSHAGFCESASSCCSGNEDCGQYDRCILKSGTCFGFETYCNGDSECGEPDSCIRIGFCVGGDNEGELCTADELGMCSDFSNLCLDDAGCGGVSCLFPPVCPGGTCELCGGGCYVATASFGTDLEGKIGILTLFRDRYLKEYTFGRDLVETYYRYSPPIADYIAERHWLRFLVRISLLPIIGLVSLLV